MVYKQPKSKYWWYKFTWNGELIRESTKQTNKRVAEQMEAAHRTALAKGEVGIREKKPAPTLTEFAEADFLPFIRRTKEVRNKEKSKTVLFYETCVQNLTAFAPLGKARLDEIRHDAIQGFIDHRKAQKLRNNKNPEISTVNRDLATLRRMLRCAQDWGRIAAAPKVTLLAGENRRERALTDDEANAYLQAATELAHTLELEYQAALRGIRVVCRGEQPLIPDAFLLRDVGTIMLDAGLRPEECHRLRPENVRDGAIWIFTGKSKAARRRIPVMTDRLRAALDMRLSQAQAGVWLFPAATKSGHIEASTLKKQHAKAMKQGGVARFEPYILRHTCLTNWAKWMDPYTLHKLAGHADMKTTLRYIHVSDEYIDAMVKARKDQGGHTSRHTREERPLDQPTLIA